MSVEKQKYPSLIGHGIGKIISFRAPKQLQEVRELVPTWNATGCPNPVIVRKDYPKISGKCPKEVYPIVM